MAHKMLDGVTAVGASNSIKLAGGCARHTVQTEFVDYGTTGVSALVVKLQGSLTGAGSNTGIVSNPVLAIGSTAERVANGAFIYRIAGTNYSKGAVAAGTALPTGYAITTACYGVIMVYINAAGTISYNFPATTQAYASVALAMAAGDAMETPASLCYFGRVLCYNNTGSEWNSQTDDLTNASDITNAVFMDANVGWYDMATYTFNATDLAAQGAVFSVTDMRYKYVRLYLSTLTGSGKVTAYYEGGA